MERALSVEKKWVVPRAGLHDLYKGKYPSSQPGSDLRIVKALIRDLAHALLHYSSSPTQSSIWYTVIAVAQVMFWNHVQYHDVNNQSHCSRELDKYSGCLGCYASLKESEVWNSGSLNLWTHYIPSKWLYPSTLTTNKEP